MRHSKIQEHAVIDENSVKPRSFREDDDFTNCRVKVARRNVNLHSVLVYNDLGDRIKRTPTYYFVAKMPPGYYDIIDFDGDYVLLKHDRADNKIYLNQCAKMWDVRCFPCRGRGYTKRKISRAEAQKMGGINVMGTCSHYEHVKCSECRDNPGFQTDLMPNYPDVSAHLKHFAKDMNISKLMIWQDDEWVEMELKDAVKDSKKPKSNL